MNFFKEDSHLSEEAVALYVDALKLESLDQLPEAIRDHVSECSVCKIEIEELFLLLEDEKYEKEESHPFFTSLPKSEKIGISLIFRIAAVFLLVLGSYGVFQLFWHKPDKNAENNVAPNVSKVTIPRDTSLVKGGEKLFADNFAVLPSLEDLVRTEYRSSTIEIQSPALNAEVGENITFQWTHAPGKHVILKILNNTGKEVHSVMTEKDTYIFKGMLRSGLYYWKLESDDELLFVGKIRKK
jgi:hypothetical protein